MTTFLYLQFAWKYLMDEDITLIDPDTDGPTIAADIMEASTLSNECITCGQLCNECHPYKICCGGCQPQRHFHTAHVSPKYRADDNFKCQLCDPSCWEKYCFNCGGKPDGTILNCKNMYEAFVHTCCLPLSIKSYRCGMCMV